MSKKLPLEVEFLHRERDAILESWRAELESSVNSHFFSEGSGVYSALMGQVFDDIVNAIDKNLYRNLNVTFDTLLRNGHQPALSVSDVREFIFQFVPAARSVLERQYPNGASSQGEIIFQRLKVIERDLRQVYSERMARTLISVMEASRDAIIDTWERELPTPIISDHFSVIDETDRRAFVESTFDAYITILRGEHQEMLSAQGDAPARSRLQDYLHQVMKFYEPKGFLISDLQRALTYPLRLLEPRLFHKLSHSVHEYRVALLSLVDVSQMLNQTFSQMYSEREMKNYYNEVSIMLHRIKNKLTAVPTTMETILMLPPDDTQAAGDPMVLTNEESALLSRWLEQTDVFLGQLNEILCSATRDQRSCGEAAEAEAPSATVPLEPPAAIHALTEAWARYQEYVDPVRSAVENARFKVDPGMVETVNELLHIVYEGGRYTTELARELQIRQNELYQREPPKRKELDIYDLVRRAYQESVAESQSREQTYELIAEDRGVKVFGVENELKRPFIQIIENAIKYTPVGGKVTVRLEYEPSHILFSVQDTGIGIPPGEEDQVFSLCERCSNAKDFNKAGTGTGLFNDRKIILHHNGQIWVKSAGVDQGSIFFIRIPIQHHPKATSA